MISPTVVKTTDKASNSGGGTEGQVVQLTDANKIHTVYLDVGTTDGKIVQAITGDKIHSSLIDTGTTDGKIVQLITGDKLPAVNASLLTSVIEALPAGMPLQIQSTQTSAEFEDIVDGEVSIGGTTYHEKIVSNLNVSIVPARASSKFKIDVAWHGGFDDSGTGDGTSYWPYLANLGFYLVQVVDVGGADTTSNLQGTIEGGRNPVIATVSVNSLATGTGTNADYLSNCKFSYIVTPTYDLGETLKYSLAVRSNQVDNYLVTNRCVDNVDGNTSQRTVSSISVTEIRGA